MCPALLQGKVSSGVTCCSVGYQVPGTGVWPVLDLNAILHALYERAAYDLRINYRQEPVPPFVNEDAQWVDALLRSAGLR